MIWSYLNRHDWRIDRLKMNMMSRDKKVPGLLLYIVLPSEACRQERAGV